MPSATLGSAFFAGLLENNRRLLNDADLWSLYHLKSDPLDGDIPHLSKSESESLRALAAYAEPNPSLLLDSDSSRSRLKDNAHASGRAALATWFSKLRIPSKLHSSIEQVLEDSNAHPRQLLEENCDDIAPETLPDEAIIHSDVELGVAIAVFGPNAVASRLTGLQVKIIKAIMHHEWNRLRKQRQRMYRTMSGRKVAWLEAEQCGSTAIIWWFVLNNCSDFKQPNWPWNV
jgi:hypothetical protein